MELKLASGMTGAGRRKHLADVQELIKVLGLKASFTEPLDNSVQAMYLKLHDELRQVPDHPLAPDWDPDINA